MTTETALATVSTIPTLTEDLALCEALVRSGSFPRLTNKFQVLARVLAGRALGWSPVFSLMSLNLIEGKLSFTANVMLAQVRQSGRYDYEVRKADLSGAELEFFRLEWPDPAGTLPTRVSLGRSRFTPEDAKRAGIASKPNYQAWAEDMFFARAASRGVRRFCPDVFMVPAYTDGEIQEARVTRVTAEVLDETPAADGPALPRLQLGAPAEPAAEFTVAETAAPGPGAAAVAPAAGTGC